MIEEAGDRDPSGARLGAMLQVMLARYPSERLPEIKTLVAAGAGAAAGQGRGRDADAGSADDSSVARSDPAAAAARRGGSGVLALRLFLISGSVEHRLTGSRASSLSRRLEQFDVNRLGFTLAEIELRREVLDRCEELGIAGLAVLESLQRHHQVTFRPGSAVTR